MAITAQENNWQTELAKARQQAQISLRVPIAVKQKQLTDQMNYYKGVLQRALEDNSIVLATETFEKMIHLRANQSAYALREKEETFGFLTEYDKQEETKKYVIDCARLAQVCDSFLNAKNK